MENNIYNIELLKCKKELLEEVKLELKQTIIQKIRSNSKAYSEIKSLITNIDKKITITEIEINSYFNTHREKYSILKIKTKSLEEFIDLKNELGIESLAELFELLIIGYKELILMEKLTKILPLNLNKIFEKQLLQADFYMCKIENQRCTVVYKFEDLIIYEENEYLNLEYFQNYTINSELFLISVKCTLQDIDKLKAIWK